MNKIDKDIQNQSDKAFIDMINEIIKNLKNLETLKQEGKIQDYKIEGGEIWIKPIKTAENILLNFEINKI